MLQISYFALAMVMTLAVILIGSRIINQSFGAHGRKKKIWLVASLLIWHVYLFAIASTGVFQSFELPPRLPLLLVFPTFIFMGIFFVRNRDKAWIGNVEGSWIVGYQGFRVVLETLLIFSVAAGVVHPYITIEGYNYDMVFAFTAPLMVLLVFRTKILPKQVAVWWNYLGLVSIASVVFLVMTTTYFFGFFESDSPLMPREFGLYPYVLVPGFIMPSAVFMHVLSIIHLRKWA